MKKIESLTADQTRRLRECQEEWRQIDLMIGPVNRDEVNPIFHKMYKQLRKPLVPLVILPSPASALLATPLIASILGGKGKDMVRDQLSDQLGGQLSDQLRDQLGGQLSDQLRDQLSDKLWDQLRGQLSDQLRDQLRDQLSDQLEGQLWDQLSDQLWGQLWDQLGGQLRDQLWYGFWGNYEVFWIAFYSFCEELGCKYSTEQRRYLKWWEHLARHCGWWWPYGKVIIAADRPTKTRWNAENRLHANDGPAIEFSDGYKLWALNGVRVSERLVMTPPEQLDPHEWVVNQSNAEIRREAVRKIGIERICQTLKARTVDHGQDHAGQPCELIVLDIGDGRQRPYIKLRHPGIGTYHLEGVPQGTTTLEQAFTFRNQTKGGPEWLR